MKYRLYIFFFLISVVSFSQHKKAYTVFTSSGKKSNFKKIVKKSVVNDVVFFGELHNNPIAHWLQFELASALVKKSELILGAEMFEQHQKNHLNNYVSGKISHKDFRKTSKLWSNYETDYKPVVDFAKENKVPFIATNITRKYASMVHKGDFKALDTLPKNVKKQIAPLPIPFDAELSQYKNILTMMGVHGSLNLLKAQAIKDATMAHFIAENYKENAVFLHLNGSYHSDFKEGIIWYLNQYKPELNVLTISVVEQENIEKLEKENLNKADFVICVPNTMTKTY